MLTSVIAVPDASGTCGVVTWWRLAGRVTFEAFSAAWDSAGLDVALLPALPAERVALRRVLRTFEGPRTSLVALPGGGYAVVDTSFEDELCAPEHQEPVHTTRFKAWISDYTGVACSSDQLLRDLRKRVAAEQLIYTASDIGAWLVSRADAMHAIRLRETGGIYFIPETARSAWSRIVEVIASVGESRIYELSAMRTQNAVAAILAALQAQADREIERIEAAIDGDGLGVRGLETQRVLCAKQLDLLTSYEGLLGARLDGLRASIVDLQARIVEAALVAASGE